MAPLNMIGAEFAKTTHVVSKFKQRGRRVDIDNQSWINKFTPPAASNEGSLPLPENIEPPRTGKASDRINYIVTMFSRHSQRA